MAAVVALNGEELNGLVRRAALVLSVPSFLDDLVVPLMDRIGRAWEGQQICPAHEHLASAVMAEIQAVRIEGFASLRAVLRTLSGPE